MRKTIPLEECKDRMVYALESRNLSAGVYVKERKGFIGIRFKWSSRILFEELFKFLDDLENRLLLKCPRCFARLPAEFIDETGRRPAAALIEEFDAPLRV